MTDRIERTAELAALDGLLTALDRPPQAARPVVVLALSPDGGKPLHDDLVALVTRGNTATDGTVEVPAAYLRVVATRG